MATSGLTKYAHGRMVRNSPMMFALLESIFLKKYVSLMISTIEAPILVMKSSPAHKIKLLVSNPIPADCLDEVEKIDWKKDENPGKYQAMFERRARKGQCFNQPYLGCREFSCSFSLVDAPESERKPIEETKDLGFMLYDLNFIESPEDPKPAWFRPHMKNGVIDVPPWESEEVRK
jgi:hypothetical protein